VSCLYSAEEATTSDDFENAVRHALHRRLIPENALLGCSIEASETGKAFFKRQTWSVGDLPVAVETQATSLEELVRGMHDTQLPDSMPWKVQILSANPSSGPKKCFWLSFTYHHAIGDGTSGLIFHNKLLRALNDNINDSSPMCDNAPFPLPIEECLDVRPGYAMLLKEAWQLVPLPAVAKRWLSPKCYLGNATTLRQRVSTKTGLRSLTLSAEDVPRLRKASKAAGVSVHAILHGVISHAIVEAVPALREGQVFMHSATPINLRPLMKHQDQTFATYVTSHASTTRPSKSIIETAKSFYEEINLPSARCKALGTVGLLKFVDHHPPKPIPLDSSRELVAVDGSLAFASSRHVAGMPQFIMQRLERPTETSLQGTFEISNLGSWKPDSSDNGSPAYRIQDISFSGSNGPIGEWLNICVATLTEGPMRLVFTYRTGFVDENEIEQVLRCTRENLMTFCT
jgi:hypothetical protein